jgi:hypothetical protein
LAPDGHQEQWLDRDGHPPPAHRLKPTTAAGAEGLGDPLVGGISLPVDAVRVDLEQDRDAVEERLQVLSPLPQLPGGVQEHLGLGGG